MTSRAARDSRNERTPLLSERVEEPDSATSFEVNALSPDDISPLKKNLLVFSLFVGAYLSCLDLTIVATCLPTISSSLNLSNQGSWIGTAYLWSTVTFTPLYGRLSDIIGRRNAYLQASLLFAFGTLLCGLAPNLATLATARFIAGMGGGGMGTVGSVVIADIIPPRDRGLYQSIFFFGVAAGMGTGGPIGGWIVERLDWHATFYLQLPLVAVCIFLAIFCLPPSKAGPMTVKQLFQRVDVLGASSLLVSIGSLLVALSLRANSNLTFPDARLILAAVLFVLFFLAFVFVEVKIAKAPVLPMSMLHRRTHLCIGIIAGVVAIVNFTMVYLLPTLFEIVFGASVSAAGLHLLPNSIAMLIGAPLVGIVVRKTGRYKWITVLCSLGPLTSMLWLAFIKKDAHTSQWLCVIPMGLGFSGLLTATLVGIMNESTKAELAVASGFVFTFRSLGQVSGVATSSAIFQAVLTKELNKRIPDKDIVEKLRRSTEHVAELPPGLRDSAREAFSYAIKYAFLFAAAGAAVVFVTSLFIRDNEIDDEEEDAKLQQADSSGFSFS